MELSATEKIKQFTIQVKATHTLTEDLEDALQTWGIDPDEYDSFDELIEALQEAVETTLEDIHDMTGVETDWEIEEISLGADQLV